MRGADVAGGELGSSYFQRLLVNFPLSADCFAIACRAMDVDLAPDTPLRAAMLAGVPLAFALDLDPGAVRCPAGYCAAMPERGSAGAAGLANRDRGC